MVNNFLKDLTSGNYVNDELAIKYGYVDFILKGPTLSSTYSISDILPQEFSKDYISNTPAIPIGNNCFVYYCRAKIEIVKRLLEHSVSRELFLADSWVSLFEMDIPFWGEIFDVETKRLQADGSEAYWRGKFSKLTKLDKVEKAYVPHLFAGDETPILEFKDWHFDKIYSLSNDPIPHELEITIQAVNEQLIEYLRRHPNALYQLKPRQFEELIGEILHSFGWEVELTPATRDGGYDIFAITKSELGLNTSWIIECKKYAKHRKVGIDYVRSICGIKNELKVANALVATTSFFSSEVKKYKNSRYDLELVDYNRLVEWMDYSFRKDKNSGLILPE